MAVRVLDASAAVELLLGTAAGRRAADALLGGAVAAPAHFDAEVLSALGRLARAGKVTEGEVSLGLRRLSRAPIRRYPLAPLLTAAWERRANLSLRDALYVTLADRLGATLVTVDRRLARAPNLGVGLNLV